ncbi:MAG: hypothetical protein M3O70_12355, partial [Actinomycetota bacterium]|nr:hypothetical protein [Actinomycetota bacterium]
LLASHRGWLDDLPGTRIGRYLDLAGLPAANRSLAAGASALAPFHEGGNLADLIRHTAHTDQGIVYVDGDGKAVFEGRRDRWLNRRSVVVTFGDQAGETTYREGEFAYDTVGLHNDVAVTGAVADAVSIQRDQASIDAFGRRELSLEVDVADISFLANRASIELQTRKDVKLRLPALDLGLVKNDERATAVNAFKLADLVRTYRRPAGESVISRRQRVQQIAESVSGGGKFWGVSVTVADAEVDADITSYGTAVYGTHRYGY